MTRKTPDLIYGQDDLSAFSIADAVRDFVWIDFTASQEEVSKAMDQRLGTDIPLIPQWKVARKAIDALPPHLKFEAALNLTFNISPARALQEAQAYGLICQLAEPYRKMAKDALTQQSSPLDALRRARAQQMIDELISPFREVADRVLAAQPGFFLKAVYQVLWRERLEEFPSDLRDKYNSEDPFQSFKSMVIHQKILTLPQAHREMAFALIETGKSFEAALKWVNHYFHTRYNIKENK